MYDRDTPPTWWPQSSALWAYSRDVIAKIHVGSRAMVRVNELGAGRRHPFLDREVLITGVHANTDGQLNGIVRVFPVVAKPGEVARGELDTGAVCLDIETIKDPPGDILDDLQLMRSEPYKTALTIDRHLVMQFRTPVGWSSRAYDEHGHRRENRSGANEFEIASFFYRTVQEHGGEIGRVGRS